MKKKVAIFCDDFYLDVSRGGSELQSYLISNELHRLGYTVYLIATRSSKTERRSIYKQDYNIFRIGRGTNILNEFVTIYKILRRERIQCCYVRTFKYLTLIGIICKLLKIPYVFNVFNIAFVWKIRDLHKLYIGNRVNFKKLSYLIKYFSDLMSILLNYWGFKCADAIICSTKWQRISILEHYKRKAFEIKQGIDVNNNRNLECNKNNSVLWIGKSFKGIEIYIKLAYTLRNCPILFIAVGVDEYSLDSETIALLKESNIAFYRSLHRDDCLNLQRQSKILVYTNAPNLEGFPNIFLEAFVCGTCVVSTWDIDNIFQTHGIGIYCKTFIQLKEAVYALINNDQLRSKIVMKAHNYVNENHNIAKNALEYKKLIDMLMIHKNKFR